MSKDVHGELRDWLLSQPLTAHDPHTSLRYIHDFVQAVSLLDLYKGGLYLDFGAGSGWIAEWLNQLGYKTIALDISLDMLRIARERQHKVANKTSLVVADGEALPFKPESFDGIICVNSFHHLPNPFQALQEMCFGLKDTGAVVFFEPGEGHSHDPRSIQDMEHLGVLEQDVTIEAMAELAQKAGFGSGSTILYSFPLPDVAFGKWPAFKDTYAPAAEVRFQSGDRHYLSSFVEHMRRHPLMKVRKLLFTHSRQPAILSYEMMMITVPPQIQAQHLFRVEVVVHNTGDTIWLAQAWHGFGIVQMGAHLLDQSGAVLQFEFARAPLDRNISPGEDVQMFIICRAPDQAGQYLVKLDMVAEGIAWFEDRGARGTTLPLEVTVQHEKQHYDSVVPHNLAALVRPTDSTAISAAPAQPVQIILCSENTGDTTWLSKPVRSRGSIEIAVRISSEKDGERFLFPVGTLYEDISPGETYHWLITFPAPQEPGTYQLKFDLLHEGRWKIPVDQPGEWTYVLTISTGKKGASFPQPPPLPGLEVDSFQPAVHHQLAHYYLNTHRTQAALEEWTIASFLAPHVEFFQHQLKGLVTQQRSISIGPDSDLDPASKVFVPLLKQNIKFGELIELVGLDFPGDMIQPGQVVRLVLYWQVLQPVSCDYTAFFHLYHQSIKWSNRPFRVGIRRLQRNKLFFQHDYLMGGPLWPTSLWIPSSIVKDEVLISVPKRAKSGEFKAELGVWLAGMRSSKLIPSNEKTTANGSIKVGTLAVGNAG
ncbi:class I SAM-dependent methyltransferase [candidate division CSSED10-310 bacterium]|uniref:Class I SAM-dependent methyltransferase n=1 Tax=candidate division CSSED10-310 bacterium TaxID=2855610 RepID=A0ABV6YXB9_UNCC1